MVYGLATVFAGVDYGAVAAAESFLAGNFCHYPEQVAEQWNVFGCCFGERDDMPARDDEHMHGGMRVNVGEGDALLIFVDTRGGDASVEDLAEEAAHGSSSVSLHPYFSVVSQAASSLFS
jgi:hypothetical protein